MPARELVPRDVVKLRIGNVTKKANSVAYASTVVKRGEMLAVVVNTGSRTIFHAKARLASCAVMALLVHAKYEPLPKEEDA